MTVQPIQQSDAGVLALPSITGGDLPGLAILGQWSQANDHATRLVAQWIFTDLVPVHHWPLPPGQTLRTMPNPRVYGDGETDESYRRRCEIAAASAAGTVLRGIALGLPPNVALEQMHSIRGTIGMKTKAKVALARSRGIKAWDVALSPESVTCAGLDPLTGETVEITVTMAMARQAGWTSNDAYSKTPIDMLWSRAMSRVLDRIAGDVLFGLASVEDIDEPAPPAAAARVTIDDVRGPVAEKISPAALAAAAPAAPAPAEQEPPALVDEPTWNAINAAFVRLGVTGPGVRQRRETAIRRIIDRPETKAEAGTSPRTWLTQDAAELVVGTLQGTDRDGIARLLGEQPATVRETTAAPAAGEQVGGPLPPRPGDVDLGDADPDGDEDFVPEPDDDERAAGQAAAAGDEPKGW